jgi:hypothetical protein
MWRRVRHAHRKENTSFWFMARTAHLQKETYVRDSKAETSSLAS